MNPLKAATLSVGDAAATAARYAACFDYRIVEQGVIDAVLAAAWGAPACAGRRQIVLRPASGGATGIRLVEAARDPAYRPLRTHGWAALELCVQDVLALHAQLRGGPFEIIGPPPAVSALPEIHAMQVQGPDAEIVYLTEIRQGGPGSGLPTAQAPVDTLFIVVAACADMAASAAWFAQQLGVAPDPVVEIPYRMLARAFDLPPAQRHRLTTARLNGEICLELDQLPPAATPRAVRDGELPPGIGLASFELPSLAAVPGPWLSPPQPRPGAIYGGRCAGTLRGPDGLLVELIEAAR